MNGHRVGYIRVSSTDQNSDRQLEGIEFDVVFEEKVSGKDRNRPELENCLKYLSHVQNMNSNLKIDQSPSRVSMRSSISSS